MNKVEKMEQALEWLSEIINDWNASNEPIQYCQYSQAIDKIDAALAAPRKNCERFNTKEDAAIAFANEKGMWIPQSVLWELAPWLDWLFQEAKQRGDESPRSGKGEG